MRSGDINDDKERQKLSPELSYLKSQFEKKYFVPKENTNQSKHSTMMDNKNNPSQFLDNVDFKDK